MCATTFQARDAWSAEEAAEAIRALGSEEHHRLRLIAKTYAFGAMTDDEILHEALLRVLDGRRVWPKDVKLASFLAGVMKSVATDERRTWWAQKVSSDGDECAANDQEATAPNKAVGDANGDPVLDGAHLARRLEEVEKLFCDDETASMMVAFRAEGYSAREIQKELDLDDRDYQALQKRVSRGIRAKFPEGWQS